MTTNAKIGSIVIILIALSLIFAWSYIPNLGVTHLGSLHLEDTQTTSPTLKINQQGTANLIQVQDSGSDIFTIVNGGGTTLSGETNFSNRARFGGAFVFAEQEQLAVTAFSISAGIAYIVITSTDFISMSTSAMSMTPFEKGQLIIIQNGNTDPAGTIVIEGQNDTIECNSDISLAANAAVRFIFDGDKFICVATPQQKAYSSIYIDDGGGAQSLTAGVPVTVTMFNKNGPTLAMSPDFQENSITIIHNGDYLLSGTFSISSSVNFTTVTLYPSVNGIRQYPVANHLLRSKGDATGVAFRGSVALETEDIIWVEAEIDKTAFFAVFDGELAVERKGP